MTETNGAAEDAEGRATAAAEAVFGGAWRPRVRASAPGRIELLGNHLDYNGGPVLAGAIDRRVVVLLSPGGREGTISVLAVDADGDRQELAVDGLRDWRRGTEPGEAFDYVRGVIAAALAAGRAVRSPAEVVVAGDVPIGFGLSSSAALCVGLALALVEPVPEGRELVLLAQQAEHRAGNPCGAMDQSASVAGGVIRFDGATLGVERLEPALGDLAFAVADSGVDRSLGESVYPERVAEAEAARETAGRLLGRDVPHLADLSAEDLRRLEAERGESAMPPTLLRRCRHVVSETARVQDGIAAIARRDWTEFGALMTASGRSSATDYEVSHPRVETLVAEALATDGVLGARMMGGGSGGSVLILVHRAAVDRLDARLRSGYYHRHGMDQRADLVEVVRFDEGARLDLG
jgi:galactokinase